MRAIRFLALLIVLVGNTATALPTIPASRCNACSDEQFEQRAIGLGLGTRYLYDFTGRQLRAFAVTREPAPGGGYIYEAVEQAVPVEYMTYFNKVSDYRQRHGTLKLVVTVNLANVPGPHGNMSVYDLYNRAGAEASLGRWLAAFIASQAANSDAGQRMIDIQRDGSQVRLQEDPVSAKIFVNFKNGRAEFELSDNGASCRLLPDTASDSDDNPIPGSRSRFSDLPYSFPGGRTSSNYQEFMALVQRLGIPVGSGSGMWACSAVDGVGESCRLVR